MDERRFAVVVHTHWDREWYATFEQFRMRLVHLVDRLLDLLEGDPDYVSFLLDAQTVVLQDYLAIRPGNAERLHRQLALGRIEVGPWYVQPDEALVSGESLVRNFLLGRRLAREHGSPGAGLRVGYLPDIFGHIAQMPQVLRGFGIDNALLWRGISGLDTQEFRWRAPDGSEVLVIHLPDRTGYSMVHHLATDPEAALRQIHELGPDLDPGAHTPLRLLLVGSDHVEPQPGLPALLRKIAALPDAPAEIAQTGLGPYVDRYRAHLEGLAPVLPVIEGEMRDTNRSPRGHFNFALPNVLSARMPIKLRNREVERELVSWAEPLAAVAWLCGDRPAREFLAQAWSYLLCNHPHDSICGCSRDEVHRQMPGRFDAAMEIAAQITSEKAAFLASGVDTSGLGAKGQPVMLINPTAYPRQEVVDVRVDLPEGNFRDVEVLGPDGSPVPAQVVSTEHALRARSVPDPALFEIIVTNASAAPKVESGWFTAFEGVRESRLRFAAKVPAFGYATYLVVPTRRPNNRGSLRRGPLAVSNGLLHLGVDPDGSVTIEHLSAGRRWTNCLRLEDGGEIGDGYSFSPPPEDEVRTWCPQGAAVIEDGPVATTLRLWGDFLLPRAIDPSRRRRAAQTVPCPVQVDLTLAAGSPLIDVRMAVTNTASDHRLRLVLRTGIPSERVRSETQWATVIHPTVPVQPDPAVWIEDAPRCHPTAGFVEVPGQPGFALIAFGLPEYEASPEGDIRLTLLRCFGHLGSPDPLTISAGAGPGFPTPDAQLLGQTIEARCALVPGSRGQDLWRLSRTWQNPCRAFPQSRHSGSARLSGSWLALPDGADLSSLKEADDGQGVILRLHNPSDRAMQGRVALDGSEASPTPVGLDEEARGAAGGGVGIGANALLTLRFVRKDGAQGDL